MINFLINIILYNIQVIIKVVSRIRIKKHHIYKQYIYKLNKCSKKQISQLFKEKNCMSHKGHNYASVALENLALVFKSKQMQENIIFKLKYTEITNSTLFNNKQLILETKKNITHEDCLTDIRLFFDNSKQETNQQNEEINMQIQKSQPNNSYAKFLHEHILKKSKSTQHGEQSIASLNQIPLKIPRGKYNIDFFPLELRLHGATFDYKIKYEHITKGFFLIMPQDQEVVLILQLNSQNGISQGHTLHKNIVIQIKKNASQNVYIKTNPEMISKYPHLSQLQQQYKNSLYQNLVDLLSGIAKINMIHPGQNFKSSNGDSCIRANVKAQVGWLFMLKQSIIYIFKPIIYLKLQNIKLIKFNRTIMLNSNFDIILQFKDNQKSVQFAGIQSKELDGLLQYFRGKNVKVQLQKGAQLQQQRTYYEQEQQDSQQDEDYDEKQDRQKQKRQRQADREEDQQQDQESQS